MSIPVSVLLVFAGWTLGSMALTVGSHRWGRIFAGRSRIADFAEYRVEGPGWYRRSLRAHANCVENLPVYGAVVVAIVATGVEAALLDTLALVLIAARVAQTVVHVALEPTDLAVAVRFTFFFVQLLAMVGMGIHVAFAAG